MSDILAKIGVEFGDDVVVIGTGESTWCRCRGCGSKMRYVVIPDDNGEPIVYCSCYKHDGAPGHSRVEVYGPDITRERYHRALADRAAILEKAEMYDRLDD